MNAAPATNPVLDAIHRRHATRAFTDEPVTDAEIGELLHAAIRAPTAMHVEPWTFVIVQDRAVLAQISDRAKAMVEAQHRTDHRPLVPTEPLAKANFNVFYDAGTLIVIGTRWPGPFAAADCWLAAENLMLAATSLGLATCPIGFALPALSDAAVRAELGLPASFTPVAPIVVGHAAYQVPAQSRREPEILCWKK